MEECAAHGRDPYRRPSPGAHQGGAAAGPSDGPGSGRPSAREGPNQGPSHASGAPTSSPSTAPPLAAPTVGFSPHEKLPPSLRGSPARSGTHWPPAHLQQGRLRPGFGPQGPRGPGRQIGQTGRRCAASLFLASKIEHAFYFWLKSSIFHRFYKERWRKSYGQRAMAMLCRPPGGLGRTGP